MEPITVFIADDHSIVREGLRQLLSQCEDLLLIGEAADGEKALKEIRHLKPRVAVLDISMPAISGLECIPVISKDSPATAVVIQSMFAREFYVQQALAAGAYGYVLKSAHWRDVIEAIRLASEGKYFLSQEINSTLIRSYIQNTDRMSAESSKYDLLSGREQQVFRMVIAGNSSETIGELLCLSKKTIEKHRSNICKKLGVSDPLSMMKFAIKIGVADPDLWPES